MKALLVDDEKPARQRLRRLLLDYPDIVTVGEATHGKQAISETERLRPDVVFLDIEMPELTGLEVAETLGVHGPAVVFVTAYNEFALKAFDAHAVDYLVKPVAKDRLQATIEKLRRNSGIGSINNLQGVIQQLSRTLQTKRLAAKTGQRYRVFDLSCISAVVAKDHYSEIIHGTERTLVDDPLDKLSCRLDADRFLRIHRSAIINVDCLKEMKREGDRKYTAVLSDHFETQLAISRDNIDRVKSFLNL